MKRILIILTIVVLVGFVIIGCSRKSTYGVAIDSNVKFVKISEIMANPESYVNTDIVLKGKISLECGSGCWFQLDDGTGQIHVDLTPANLAIPQMVGSTVTAFGQILEEDGRIVMHAAGLEF